jgi:hypothetical protein
MSLSKKANAEPKLLKELTKPTQEKIGFKNLLPFKK